MQGDNYETAPKALKAFLDALVADIVASCERMGVKLSAILLHGSLATGSFYPPESDIDLLITVDGLSENQSVAFYNLLKRHHDQRPYVGGLEASVIPDREAQKPTYPMPMLTFFSEQTFSEQTPEPPQRVDGNLSCSNILFMNVVVARTRGVTLWGLEPEVAIGEVDWDDFLAAVESDMAGVLEGEPMLRSPFLAVLNLCRWQMIRRTPGRIVPSKEEGGE